MHTFKMQVFSCIPSTFTNFEKLLTLFHIIIIELSWVQNLIVLFLQPLKSELEHWVFSRVRSPPVGNSSVLHYVHTQHRQKRGTKIGFILHKNIVKTWKHLLHINLLKQGDNVWISQIVQNIHKEKKSFSWVIHTPLMHLYLNPPPKQMPLTAIQRSSKHYDIFQTLVVSTASSVRLS